MKRILFSLFILLLISCNKEIEPKEQNLQEFNISQATLFIPNAYDQLSTLAFQNSSGEELSITLQKQTLTNKISHNGSTVVIESFTYSLSNQEEEIILEVSASTNESKLGEEELLTISNNLSSRNRIGHSIINIVIRDEQIFEISGTYIHHDFIEIAGINFSNVMESVVSDNQNSYSKVYYSAEEGIVGFMDKDNVIWGKKQ